MLIVLSSSCVTEALLRVIPALRAPAGPFSGPAKALIAAFPLLRLSPERFHDERKGEDCSRCLFFASIEPEVAAIIALFAAKTVQIALRNPQIAAGGGKIASIWDHLWRLAGLLRQ
ncbi:MAG TPA: hypothetical protein VG477_03665 [Thermoanaerobaculia bacterium]|nr:hypothetical protein [Thermoanaerobaculia bacterium]